MSPDVALIAADHYTLESGWQDELSKFANDIESKWNNEIAVASSEEVSVDAPPISGHEDSVPTPSSDQDPKEYRDDVRATVDYTTSLFQDYDTVVVRTGDDMGSYTGVAYTGDIDPSGTQAAGTDHGLGIVFQTPHPRITTFHELLHTFSARHSDGDRDYSDLHGGENTIMCNRAPEGCDGNWNYEADTWELTNCTVNAVADYMSAWGVY